MQSFLIPLIVGLVTAALLTFLNKATQRPASLTVDGFYFLRLEKIYNTGGYISIALGIASLSGLLFKSAYEPVALFGIAVMFILFFGIGLSCVLLYRNHYVKFNDTDIEVSSLTGKAQHTTWKEITNVAYKQNSGHLTLITGSGKKIKIHHHLIGLGRFISFLEANTPFTAAQLKMQVKSH